MLPFIVARKLPIYVYKGFKLERLDGKIIINSSIKRGMILVGSNPAGFVSSPNGSLRMMPNSILILREKSTIAQGCHVFINSDATFDMGNSTYLGDSSKVICYKQIVLGDKSEITWESQVTDYKSHYILNLETEKIENILDPVIIGKNCWIGNRTTIMPGTKLPDNIIVTSNSLLNKDYIKLGVKSYSMLSGMPAKLIKDGNIKRIYSYKNEQALKSYFKISFSEQATINQLVDIE